MIHRFSTLALGALLSLCSISSKAQGFGIIIDSLDLGPNQIGCLAVRSVGFTNIVTFQYPLTWDPNVLEFHHIQHVNLPGGNSFLYTFYPPRTLLLNWSNSLGTGSTVADTTVHYEVCFKAIGVAGSHSDISVGGDLPAGSGGAEAYDINSLDQWTDSLMVNGHISIGLFSGVSDLNKDALAFQLAPNPSSGITQILLHSDTEGPAQISVSDALGREVFGQQVRVLMGENKFEIPANALTAKGMYQVTLQTKTGTSTQILSVQ